MHKFLNLKDENIDKIYIGEFFKYDLEQVQKVLPLIIKFLNLEINKR